VLPVKYALSALFFACALTFPVQAQGNADLPVSIDNGQLVYEAQGHRLAWPLPDWLSGLGATSDTLGDFVSADVNVGDDQANLELFPKGESQAYWTTLYGARITAPGDMPLTQLRQAVVNVYARACKPETVAVFQLEPDNGDVIPPLGFMCGAYLDGVPAYSGKGEVMVVGFMRTDRGVGMVYQEWRGNAFDPADATTWPVQPEVIEARVAQFKSEVSLQRAD
jgi:hypothetical protein